uniref:TolB amino-terminal domain-containing protein n=1 Tax=uncultured bacterium pEAF66 TaxID=480414 RepID=B0LFR5_9BACT|nr:unknown [uncultured bacterium pEAF66]
MEAIIDTIIDDLPNVAPVRHDAPGAACAARDLRCELENCLARILASPGFARAPRMRRLLSYLVEQELAFKDGNSSEYAIGMEVFDRDPRAYNTCTDPIVRVQMRRLRDKLQQYYAAGQCGDPLQIAIPLGGYALSTTTPTPRVAAPEQIAWQRLLCLTPDGPVRAFATGLNEELADCLHHALGARIDTMPEQAGGRVPPRRLEGTLRADSGGIRVALRLADKLRSCVLWSRQFDFAPTLSIAAQVEVAHRLAFSVQEYLHGESKL